MPRIGRAYERVLRLLPAKPAQLVRTIVSTIRRVGVLTASVVIPSKRRANRIDLVLFAWGLDEDQLERAISSSGVEPAHLLVVTNSPAFGPLRRHHCYFEYVPSREDFERALGGASREAFLERRLENLLDSYSYRRVALAGGADELRGPLGKVAAHVNELETA